ncbi:three-helix bundle dimerization domain-containing protein [Phytohabitans houttuyneae]|uniref:Uncharacterized protein n=1 Tax=Phytohabitans houttuyneae TaxID=1076126 RepID=A0A6V8K8Y6_9ACTN|nr:hypothetical protein Phou_058520 [Phytohabitans houttuyneae]
MHRTTLPARNRSEHRYAGTHSPQRVGEAIAAVYARFSDARVHTYVPLLAERAVRDLLDAGGSVTPR